MTTTTAAMPPGPKLHRALQTLAFIAFGPRFLEACRKRYGNAVTFSTLFDERFVMLFDPELVKQLFTGSPQRLHAGEANALLGPILGSRSVLVLDGDEHLRHRRLMLPAFHGRRLEAYAETITAAADAEIDAWPVGRPFPLLPSMQSLTLGVIMQAVFGYAPGEAGELRERLRAMIAPLASPRDMMTILRAGLLGANRATAQMFAQSRKAVDEILYAEIAARRAVDDLETRDDVFSALLIARDEDGVALTDEEVRDELVTLLMAGHETTATGLAWTFDLLLHAPDVLSKARREFDSDEYLDAVVKESLRIRPVIPGVGRVVKREPFTLGGYEIPPGIEVNPSIRLMHWREDLYPDPKAFRPERFLGPDAPDTYTWVPFGGGTRRCLGASFAQMEMRLVLRRVLRRATLWPANKEPDEMQFRAITIAPKHGAPVVMSKRDAA
jgi:cytochrome P450